MTELVSHYRVEGGTTLVEMTLSSVAQFFNSFDPAPFYEKELDRDAVDYILAAVSDLPPETPMKIVIYLPPASATGENARMMERAVRAHFTYLVRNGNRQMRLRFREGRINMAIGLLFLFACLSAHQFLTPWTTNGFAAVIRESFIIIGWVALWEPVQFFLYGWHPARRMRRVYLKVIGMPVEVRAVAGDSVHP
ncbi:hypothetical protein Metli_2206 [Methanofollis liminatans DSM 4140]|jgi:hypothetical protein|uniref:Uncharacterized protein n=1 Tax=Methanofollis liminatans DSM 4140 TaxID=28892 RepID=J1L4U3_9EURY|nr:hypothetical protein [Methanofollis liminatans]EJG08147.1 hypothetical protein Metli_2206 [Methanofollis liminatans DSM 4140]